MRILAVIFGIAVIGGISLTAWWVASQPAVGGATEFTKLPDGTLLFDVPGTSRVRWKTAAEAKLGPAADVIGVVIGAKSRCFLVRAMEAPELDDYAQTASHIVNEVVGDTALSVTYCDVLKCTRVLTGNDGKPSPLPLSVGGWSWDKGLLLMYEGERFEQESRDLPLRDVEFERLTLGEWLKKHPDTLIYDGTLLERDKVSGIFFAPELPALPKRRLGPFPSQFAVARLAACCSSWLAMSTPQAATIPRQPGTALTSRITERPSVRGNRSTPANSAPTA